MLKIATKFSLLPSLTCDVKLNKT